MTSKEEAVFRLRNTWDHLCNEWKACEALGLTVRTIEKTSAFGLFNLGYPPFLKLEISETTTKKY
jgi:hypothetical protein